MGNGGGSVSRIAIQSAASGTAALGAALDELLKTRFITRYVAFLVELAEGYRQTGKIASAQAAVDEALERCHRNEEFWYIAEILRVKGELARQANEPSESAEALFRESRRWASEKGYLTWELLTAMSLARLYRDRNEVEAARLALEPVYRRFTEGFASANLIAAKALLDALK